MTTELHDELLLVDLSSLAHPIWHMTTDNLKGTVHTAIVDRVRALASQHPHAAICCDAGKSFRADIDPTYKANRPESDAVLRHEIVLAIETLQEDGFPVWCVPGFEADDLIASATYRALEIPDTTVLIVSADKDLLALVNGRVRAKSLTNGAILDAEAVVAKFNVLPAQMPDYLALVGDKSDNITGAKGIGTVTAGNLLGTFATLHELYAAIDAGDAKLSPSVLNSLVEFRDRMPTVRELIKLRTDVPLPFEEIAVDRKPKEPEPMPTMDVCGEPYDPLAKSDGPTFTNPPAPTDADAGMTSTATLTATLPEGSPSLQGIRDMAKHQPRTATEVLAPAPVDFERQLEPRTILEAKQLAEWMFAARLFNGYGNAPAVLATMMAGRELGFQAIASLRAFHVIDNKQSLAADAMRAKVLRSGLAKYFRLITSSDEGATWETWRVNDPEPTPFTFTIVEGRRAYPGDDRAWAKSNWGARPKDMVIKTASAKLCRLVYADVLFGLYAPEELRD